ncbi:tat pathway signal sequence [Apiosordaria backusii]|uniref:Tat pathway signal sequence n=1 Tax=Apiosordaria backusii TaxID=314023 RepID=A0AA40BE30_9PEZI|nr:tat pathway signal sequence [Apiosordaria backusii]
MVEYVPVRFRRAFGKDLSPYQGWPDDEKDDLWEELYSYGASIHIDGQAAERLHDKTERAPVPGFEDRYVVGIDVFHQLHCLNMIRMGLFPGRYNTSMKRPDGTINYLQWLHMDHCIESLRQSITCHSDISVFTYWWLESKKVMEPELGTMHVCRNFSRIRAWAFDRFLNLEDRRKHVENGRIVNYAGWGPNPENAPGVEEAPRGWKSNVADL